MSDPYTVIEPRAVEVPVLVSIPHTGTELIPGLEGRLAGETVRALPDTDWHLHELYAFAPELGVRVLQARFSRYVIDLNRPPDRAPLYPGRFETGLVPTTTFDGDPLYAKGRQPDAAEVEERTAAYWHPYHRLLESELGLLRARYGYAILFDAHSIRSRVPRLAAGELPGFILGTRDGASAAPELSAAVLEVLGRSGISFRPNDPFKGGFITRHLGRPEQHVHALQLEMCQRLYMDERPPFSLDPARTQSLVQILRESLEALIEAGATLHR